MTDKSVPKTTDPADQTPLSSPYGPQYKGVDEAAGGADSSPFENESTDARGEAAETPPRQTRGSGDAVNP